MRSPAFRFYADDFTSGTLDLSQAEVGAYIRLLCHQWNRGSIPVEPDKLARLAGGSVSVDVLAKFPEGSDGLRRNHRLEEERQKQDHFRELQREKGISSGKSRRTAVEPGLNRGSNPVGIPVEPGLNLPFPSPLPLPAPANETPLPPSGGTPAKLGDGAPPPAQENPKRKRKPKVDLSNDPGFLAFWEAYPKRISKGAAMNAWAKVSQHPDEVARIVADVQKRKTSPDWLKDSGQFIPYPASYLNARRWEDIVETSQSAHSKLAELDWRDAI